MSNFLKISALFFLFSCSLNAQTPISAADQKGIEECYNAFMSAFDKTDASTLGPWFTENAEHISPMGDLVRGRTNLVTYYGNLFNFFKSQPKADKTERNNTNFQSRYLSTDLILSTYTSEDIRYFGDKKESSKMSASALLRKTGGKWLAELIVLTPVAPMPPQGK